MLAHEERRPGFANATERSTKRKVEETMQHTHTHTHTHTQRAHSKITLTYAAKTAVDDIVRPKSPGIALPKRSLTRAGPHHVSKLC